MFFIRRRIIQSITRCKGKSAARNLGKKRKKPPILHRLGLPPSALERENGAT